MTHDVASSAALIRLLTESHEDILSAAFRSLSRSHLSGYEKVGPRLTQEHLRALLDLIVQAVKDKHLTPVIEHAEAIARERHAAGFDLAEVQTAFNVLEEAIWHRILAVLPPGLQGHALGLVGTVLGAGKDTLARTYVFLASRTHVPTLNLEALFEGAAGAPSAEPEE